MPLDNGEGSWFIYNYDQTWSEDFNPGFGTKDEPRWTHMGEDSHSTWDMAIWPWHAGKSSIEYARPNQQKWFLYM